MWIFTESSDYHYWHPIATFKQKKTRFLAICSRLGFFDLYSASKSLKMPVFARKAIFFFTLSLSIKRFWFQSSYWVVIVTIRRFGKNRPKGSAITWAFLSSLYIAAKKAILGYSWMWIFAESSYRHYYDPITTLKSKNGFLQFVPG